MLYDRCHIGCGIALTAIFLSLIVILGLVAYYWAPRPRVRAPVAGELMLFQQEGKIMADTRTIDDPGVFLIRNVDDRQVITITEDSRVVFEGLITAATVATDDRGITTARLDLIHED